MSETNKPTPRKRVYYRATVKWKHGFQYDSYVADYEIKSLNNSISKLDWVDSLKLQEITEEEYKKGLDIPSPSASEASKPKRKKVVKNV